MKEIFYDSTCDKCEKKHVLCFALDGDMYTPPTIAFCKDCLKENEMDDDDHEEEDIYQQPIHQEEIHFDPTDLD